MSTSSWNFKDNLTVDNNKFLKFLDSTGVTKNNVIGLNTASNLYINSALSGDIYFNSGSNTKSNTFFHANSIGNTFNIIKCSVYKTSRGPKGRILILISIYHFLFWLLQSISFT